MTRQKSEGGLGPLRGRVAALPAGPEITRLKATAQERRRARCGLRPAASHIRRGSNVSAAKMVVNTTAQKASAPTPGSMVTARPNCTSAPKSDSMKMSTIDQRPIQATM
jgi:hypothetical protein